MDRILACVDDSSYASSVCDLAAWAARRLGLEIELLHVVQRKTAVTARHDLSGAIGLGVKGDLLEELTRIDEAEAKLAVERGRLLLAGAEERLRAAGLTDIHLVHRHGGMVETIIEREADARGVVIGKRGASSEFATDHIGSKIERVVRASSKPVLIASREIPDMRTAVVAFDGSASATRALELVGSSAMFEGMAIHIVMAGPDDRAHRSRLDKAVARMTALGWNAAAHIGRGRADNVIGRYVTDQAASMLVMGAYGHSPLRTLIVGSTTTTMIRTVEVPVLLVR